MSTMTPIQVLRNLVVRASNYNEYYISEFDRWVNTYVKTLSCTYTETDLDSIGQPQHYVENLLERHISNEILKTVERRTSECLAHPPHRETTMTVQIIAKGEDKKEGSV